MEALTQLVNTVIGKVLIWIIIVLIGVIIALGFYTLRVSGERNVLEQKVQTEAAETMRQKDNVTFYKLWMERDKLDALKKEAEYNRTMAAKPIFKTKIEYIPTGDNCVDLNAIIDEVRGNKKAGGTQ